jgi:CheY-like chemotaxis protein
MDDEADILAVGTMVLRHLGYDVVPVSSGEAAVAAVAEASERDQGFDIVILDLYIPNGMSGIETLSQLRLIDPDLKAIVSSGYANDPICLDYEAHGFQGSVPKPYEVTDMARELRRVLSVNSPV